MPASTILERATPFAWGAAAGALALAIIGFGFGGWVTGSAARASADNAANQAGVAALAPICAARFKAQDGGAQKLAELLAIGSWSRGDAVEKSGFAAIAGNEQRRYDIARACADILGRT